MTGMKLVFVGLLLVLISVLASTMVNHRDINEVREVVERKSAERQKQVQEGFEREWTAKEAHDASDKRMTDRLTKLEAATQP